MTSLDKSFTVLQQVADHGPRVRLGDLQELTGTPKPTLHRLLHTMLEHGLVRQDGAGTYSVGSHLFALAAQVYRRISVPSEVRQVMIELQQHVSETIHLSAFQRGQLVYVEKLEAPHPFQMISRVGKLQPIHSSSIGKSVLSQLTEAEASAILLSEGMPRTTPHTIVDRRVLLDLLPSLRAQGYAVDDEEDEAGLRGVGTAICDRAGYPTGGLSIVAPAFRMSLDQAQGYVRVLIEAAKSIQTLLIRANEAVASVALG